MKHLRRILCLCLALVVCLGMLPAGAGAEAARTGANAVTIGNLWKDHRDGSYNAGMVKPVDLALNGTAQIDLTELNAMYPNAAGLWGVVNGTGVITVTADDGRTATGEGLVEFAFPGAKGVSVTGQGSAVGMFLPAPYIRLHAADAVYMQEMDPSILAWTADGEEVAFFLAEPGVYVENDLSTDQLVNTYILADMVEPLTSFNRADHEIYDIGFTSATPTVMEFFLRDEQEAFEPFRVITMEQLYMGDMYQIWAYAGCPYVNEESVAAIRAVLDASIELALEDYIPENGVLNHTVVSVMPDDDMLCVDGIAYA